MPVSCAVQKPKHQAAAQLVAVLLEDPREFQDAGIAGGVVGGLRARPGILVAADHHEVVAAGRLDLAGRDLHRPPAILDIRPHADAHRALADHLPQLQPGGAGDADAGQGRHLGPEASPGSDCPRPA